jgi:hypothetical protein
MIETVITAGMQKACSSPAAKLSELLDASIAHARGSLLDDVSILVLQRS